MFSTPNAPLSGTDFRENNLSYSCLKNSDLTLCNFKKVSLRYADLSYTELCDSDLSYSDLSYANLSFADLRGTDLTGCELRDTIGNNMEIKTIYAGLYIVTYTYRRMQIGCEQHSISEWWDFDDATIRYMGGRKALEWWRIWKPILQKIIEVSPARPIFTPSQRLKYTTKPHYE